MKAGKVKWSRVEYSLEGEECSVSAVKQKPKVLFATKCV